MWTNKKLIDYQSTKILLRNFNLGYVEGIRETTLHTEKNIYMKLLTARSNITNNFTFWEQQCNGKIIKVFMNNFKIWFIKLQQYLTSIFIKIPLIILCMFYWLDMGEGWGPAIINSLTELKTINENVQHFNDKVTFFIGGATNTETGEDLDLFEYQKSITGQTVLISFHFLN